MKTLSKAVAIASLLSAGIMSAQVANADVEYSAGLATTYLWRGTDLGGAAFSGAADYSHESGAYAGLWVSSGDASMGNEYDLFVGFAKEFGMVSVDVSVATYAYSSSAEDDVSATVDTTTSAVDTPVDISAESMDGGTGSIGELSELIVSVGIADASLGYIANLQTSDYSYITLGYSVAGADITYGMSDDDGEKYSHLDVSYGLTDALAITVSQPIEDTEGAVDTDTIVVMSYSLPL